MPVDLRMRCLRMCPVNGQGGQDRDRSSPSPIHGSLSYPQGFTATTSCAVASVLYPIHYLVFALSTTAFFIASC
ncbi:hypothetical protein DL95DRAFT_384504 [Leptodontidium sp. 2 PMI_412]|nr:hypothetical protein DL95DRAFT_384504 [Leptodontidium sp. 2 PMI_412]